ncbi:MAG: glycoside hydrolase domain-containing protein [Acidobacteriota bacterium]
MSPRSLAGLAAAAFVLIFASATLGQGPQMSLIHGAQAIDVRSAVAYTNTEMFVTRDRGASWGVMPLGIDPGQRIASVHFSDVSDGLIVIVGGSSPVTVASISADGTESQRSAVPVAADDLAEAALDDIIIGAHGWTLTLAIRLTSSSNFERRVYYSSEDGGHSWTRAGSDSVPGGSSESSEFKSLATHLPSGEGIVQISTIGGTTWLLTQSGECFGVKSTCVQQTRLRLGDGTDVTPPLVTELFNTEREMTRRGAAPMFAVGPGGTTRTSLNRGFDKCQAGSVAQMQLWWDNSPLYDSNIYFSGRNRACASQPLTTTWINQVTAMGWGLIPTVVGYQSPCTASTTTAKLSYDPVMSETQGRGEADIAVTDATNIGLTTGSVLYYDMERYDPPSPDTLGCRTATLAFLKGWTDRVKELGYKSGVYGSPKNAQEDWALMAAADKPDAIWMARWDNITSVWTYLTFPNFPTTEWANHQRIKQWQAPHNETWGGVTFNIDGNNSDGPVAGIAILKNRNADFDGDGRSDISVFRPSDGVWYVLSSIDQTFKGVAFGTSGDVIAPGDYDGDGKTDYCVFRPADGVWHMLNKAGIYSARAFGAAGDIPVPADYNGDGMTDLAVFRPSNGVWYIANSDSQGSYNFVHFGQSGDKPVPADYDGDGRTDFAVYRPSEGNWYILPSSGSGFYGIRFGVSTDLPAQGDYDGDGKADQAVFRDGTWFVLQSTAGFTAMQFGQAGDIPASGDFDGDGKTDISVFRPSDGSWYEMRSSTGFWAAAFGFAGDRPVENAYVPQ